MAFRFSSTAYHFSKAWSPAEKTHALTIFKLGVQTGARPADMMKMLKKAGVGYRKTNMLEDIGRAQGIEYSKTVGSYKRVEAWYEQAEKYRAMNPGMKRPEAAKFMQTWKNEAWVSVEQSQQADKLEMEGGCPSPPC